MRLEADPIIVDELQKARRLVEALEQLEQGDIGRQIHELKLKGWVELNYSVGRRPYLLLCSPDSGVEEWKGKAKWFDHIVPDDFAEWLRQLPDDQHVWIF